jgi:hypothetical protein
VAILSPVSVTTAQERSTKPLIPITGIGKGHGQEKSQEEGRQEALTQSCKAKEG